MPIEVEPSIKNLFLIFPPGTGGNHLANMLSLHPLFSPRFTNTDQIKKNLKFDTSDVRFSATTYNDQMQEFYSICFDKNTKDDGSTVAHFSDLENLQVSKIKEFKDSIVSSDGIYIFCSHAVEYCIGNRSGLLNPFLNRKFCVLSRPTENNPIIFNRMLRGAWANGETSIEIWEKNRISNFYKIDSLLLPSRRTINHKNSFILDTDIFFTVEGFDYINQVFKENMGIVLPEECRNLHQIYIEYVSTREEWS